MLSGSVVLDLKRMNRILEVNERNACALVEPGVSYFDLYRYIQERGLKLWIDCPDPGWGSVVGNALDHGAGYTMNPYRDHFAAQCGMEVVTGAGDLYAAGFLYVDRAKFQDVFCRDVPAADARIAAATQKPVSGSVFTASVPGGAWKTVPSWYIVASEDRAINPELERFYAKRIGATTTEIKSSHVPFLSHPKEVVKVIVAAATAPHVRGTR